MEKCNTDGVLTMYWISGESKVRAYRTPVSSTRHFPVSTKSFFKKFLLAFLHSCGYEWGIETKGMGGGEGAGKGQV